MKREYKYLPFFFLAIILLVPFGFRRYFARLFSGEDSGLIIHLHALVMSIWCLILVLQPTLIVLKKHLLHRRLGKITYFFIPVLIFIMYLTVGLPFSYDNMSTEETGFNAPYIFMPFAHMLIFTTFYGLAMRNTLDRALHLRFIIIASVSLFGPTVGRIDLGPLSELEIGFDLLFIDLVLASLLLFDLYKKKNFKPFAVGLLVYGIVHICNLTFAYTEVWHKAALLLYPRL